MMSLLLETFDYYVHLRRMIVDIDRPFYFSITNKCWDPRQQRRDPDWICPFDRVPLFVGKVVNPLPKE